MSSHVLSNKTREGTYTNFAPQVSGFNIFMTFAGLPATTEHAGTSLTTTAPAPIIESCPIVISPMMQTFGPIVTLSSIHGHFFES